MPYPGARLRVQWSVGRSPEFPTEPRTARDENPVIDAGLLQPYFSPVPVPHLGAPSGSCGRRAGPAAHAQPTYTKGLTLEKRCVCSLYV